jgi:hypothetical protein
MNIEINENDTNWLLELTRKGKLLKYAPINICCDFTHVLAAVTQNGMALKYASHDLQDNPIIAVVAIKSSMYGDALCFVSERLQKSPEIYAEKQKMKTLIEDDINKAIYGTPVKITLEQVHPLLKKNKEFVLRVVKMDPSAYQFVTGKLKNDTDIVNAVNKINL